MMDDNDVFPPPLFPPPQRLDPVQQERIRSALRAEMSTVRAPGRSRRTRRRWQIGLTAAAAGAVAVAVTLAVTVPGGSPARPAAAPPSAGSRILLAAAATVASQAPGRYWHLYIHEASAGIPGGAGAVDVIDQWTASGGTFWTSPPCREGTVVMRDGGSQYETFGLGSGSANWTYDLVRHWPASAAGLRARIATYSHSKSDQLSALTALELLVPAPPAVRAAAYRAIAAFPGVQDRGTVQGGQALFIPARDGGPLRLVIDPATGLIHSEIWPEASGQMSWDVDVAQWANQLPKVVPDNKYYCGQHH